MNQWHEVIQLVSYGGGGVDNLRYDLYAKEERKEKTGAAYGFAKK